MAERSLDQYRDEILEIYQGGRVQQKVVIETLRKRHGLRITPSTLSRWLKEQPEAKELPAPGTPRVTAEEENFLSQAQVFAWLKEEMAAVREDLVNIYARLSVIEDANANRHKLIVDAFHDIPRAVAEVLPEQQPVRNAVSRYTPPRPMRGRRRIPWKSILVILCLVLLAGTAWYFKPQIMNYVQPPPSMRKR